MSIPAQVVRPFGAPVHVQRATAAAVCSGLDRGMLSKRALLLNLALLLLPSGGRTS